MSSNIAESVTINIRAIQHYMYCPRRFALLEVNADWAENASVVGANLMHENVHSGTHKSTSVSVVSRSSVSIYNDEEKYNIFGVADCIEFVKQKGGINIGGLKGEYAVKIIEYKPTQPKNADFHESDAIQVFAQKLCVDSLWKCSSEGYIYYADTRKRVKLPFGERYDEYSEMIIKYLINMREIIKSGVIPSRAKGKKCSGCSLEDYCFSKSSRYSVKDEILATENMEEQ